MKRSAPSNTVFIGKLSSRVREDDLHDEFRRYGRIRDVDFRRHRGFAFIEYNSSSDARAAVQDMDGQRFEDSRIVVQFKEGKGDKDRRPPPNVDICYNCGKKGHWANECKEAPLGSRNNCYRCGKPGHIKKNCSLSRTPSKKRDSPKRSKKSSRRRDSRSKNRSESKDRNRSRDRKRRRSVSRSSSSSSRSRNRSSKRSNSSSRSSSRSKYSRRHKKNKSRSRSKSNNKNRSKSNNKNRSKSNNKKTSSPQRKNIAVPIFVQIAQDSQIPLPIPIPE